MKLVRFALLLCLPQCLYATSHVYVLTADGVWLASDTLMIYRDQHGKDVLSKVCKVVLNPGRMIFNAGSFRSFSKLEEAESRLPVERPDRTIRRIIHLMFAQHPKMPGKLAQDPTVSVEMGGLVQVQKNGFQAARGAISVNLVDANVYVFPLKPGIPHGFGKEVDAASLRASRDPSYARSLMENPKSELTRILQSAAADPTEFVAAPFTLLLLHPNGTISDFSDEPVCKIPEDARANPENPSRHLPQSAPQSAPQNAQ